MKTQGKTFTYKGKTYKFDDLNFSNPEVKETDYIISRYYDLDEEDEKKNLIRYVVYSYDDKQYFMLSSQYVTRSEAIQDVKDTIEHD